MADGYLLMVGRLDMPAAVWEGFAEGTMVGFVDGVEIEPVSAELAFKRTESFGAQWLRSLI